MVGWIAKRWHSIWHLGLTPRSGNALLFAVVCVGIATVVRVGAWAISPDSAASPPVLFRDAGRCACRGWRIWNIGGRIGRNRRLFSVCTGGLGPCSIQVGTASKPRAVRHLLGYCWASQSYRGLLQQLRATEVTRELLNRELVHRIKNVLANVQGIVGQTLVDQKTLRDVINARIAALGATNDLLVKSDWQSASLREILIS